MLREAGFMLGGMKVVCCDPQWLRARLRKHYGPENKNVVLYEHFVRATRPAGEAGDEG